MCSPGAVRGSIEATIGPTKSQSDRQYFGSPRSLSYVENSCPPGYWMPFVRRCTLSIPDYDWSWVDSGGHYICCVKGWKCLGYERGHFKCQRLWSNSLRHVPHSTSSW